jgi:hypothetical protein
LFLALISAASFGGETSQDFPFPTAFDSRDAAAAYAHGRVAGGDVDMLKVGDTDVLIVYIHGSGVRDIAIAAYRLSEGHWQLATQFHPPPGEVHKAIVSGKEVVVIGERTKRQWTLLKLD